MPINKTYAASLTLPDLQKWLRAREELGWEMTDLTAASDQVINFATFTLKENPDLPKLELLTFEDAKTKSFQAICSCDLYVEGALQEIVAVRNSAEIQPTKAGTVLTGKISTFGGPADTGVKPDEGLALINPNEVSLFPAYFLPAQPPGTTGLARRLNNTGSHYIACRWDYSQTPRAFLRKNKVVVKFGDKQFEAQPVDWGPGRQNRIADLSDKLASDLGVTTDNQTVTITIPASEQSNDFPVPDNPAGAVQGAVTATPASFDALINSLRLRYFTAAEILNTTHRTSHGVTNSEPPPNLWKNIVPVLIVLEKVRQEFGAIVPTSTYRSPQYNKAVGGVSASQHMAFRAIDFYCQGGTTAAVAAFIKGLRGTKFQIPIAFSAADMVKGDAPLDAAALNFTPVAGGTTEFTFHGGVKGYADENFIHIDCRGEDSNWG